MGVICSLTTKSLHRIVMWFAPINSKNYPPAGCEKTLISTVLATVGICIAILTLTEEKQSAKWVFTNITDGSGWGSKTFSFLLGFISVAWTMTDYDGTTQYVNSFIKQRKQKY